MITFDDLSEVYMEELKKGDLYPIPPGFWKDVDDLIERLHQDHERELARDPDSIMCEGAKQRLGKARQMRLDIIRFRGQKLSRCAVTGFKPIGATPMEMEVARKHLVSIEVSRMGGDVILTITGAQSLSAILTPSQAEDVANRLTETAYDIRWEARA